MESFVFTADQQQELVAGIKAAIADQTKGVADAIAKHAGRLLELEQRMAGIRGGGPIQVLSGPWAGPDPFAGDGFASRLKMVQEGQGSTGRIMLPGIGLKAVKALVNFPPNNSPSTGTFDGGAQRGPIVGPVQRPLTLLDYLPSIPVSAHKYEYVQLSRTNNANVQQDEGDQKPETEFDSELMDASIATVAHWTQASRQVLGDSPQLGTMLRNVLAVDALTKFETLLISGNGTTDKIDGLVNQATTLMTSGSIAPDVISSGLGIMSNNGYPVSVVVMNPLDWAAVRTLKDNEERYLVGSYATPAAPNVWNTPIVQSSGMPQGQSLLIDSARVAVLDREQVNVMLSTEDRDNFVRNLVTILAELRGGLAVFDVGGVGLVQFEFPT